MLCFMEAGRHWRRKGQQLVKHGEQAQRQSRQGEAKRSWHQQQLSFFQPGHAHMRGAGNDKQPQTQGAAELPSRGPSRERLSSSACAHDAAQRSVWRASAVPTSAAAGSGMPKGMHTPCHGQCCSSKECTMLRSAACCGQRPLCPAAVRLELAHNSRQPPSGAGDCVEACCCDRKWPRGPGRSLTAAVAGSSYRLDTAFLGLAAATRLRSGAGVVEPLMLALRCCKRCRQAVVGPQRLAGRRSGT